MSTIELLIVVIVILWLLGFLVYPVGGSLIHVLLVLLVVLILVRVLEGRRPLP